MEDIFLKNLPSLDLHGYDRETARVATEDFIDENIILKNDKILIIHGKGLGVVRKSVHNVLSKRKEVTKYKNIQNYEDNQLIHYKDSFFNKKYYNFYLYLFLKESALTTIVFY